MAQAQVSKPGFLEIVLQLDRVTSFKIKSGQVPHLEISVGSKKCILTQGHWNTILSMSTKINTAFSLVSNDESKTNTAFSLENNDAEHIPAALFDAVNATYELRDLLNYPPPQSSA